MLRKAIFFYVTCLEDDNIFTHMCIMKRQRVNNLIINFKKNLNEIFSKKEYRNINGDQTFNYNREKYLITGYPGNLKNKMIIPFNIQFPACW